ncbi:Diacylglycerol O-acyltransferase 3 [Camellia lanceoleosa]|uniref:Diacylglycerol O-acyltransferase 3 n=1 Tax=Camellia lanceoleosa TaxID=1840588 RepID=A0ACC0GTR4_9ERIC|nr:Diacylglycerol O-acyltransferase 3 [Camellia lanceoleosa]
MEISGVVFRPIPCYSGAGIDALSHSSSKPSVSSVTMGMPVHGGAPFSCRLLGSRGSRIRKFSNYGFCDDGHMQYYYGYGSTPPIRAGTGKKDHEATELLLAQLQQLKAEEEELKKKRKEDKAKLKAASMQNRLDCELSSGPSSESSSDSECGEVVDMSCLKSKTLAPSVVNELQPVMQEATLTFPSTPTQEANATELQSLIREAMLAVPTTMNQEGKMIEKGVLKAIHVILNSNAALKLVTVAM